MVSFKLRHGVKLALWSKCIGGLIECSSNLIKNKTHKLAEFICTFKELVMQWMYVLNLHVVKGDTKIFPTVRNITFIPFKKKKAEHPVFCKQYNLFHLLILHTGCSGENSIRDKNKSTLL